MGFKKLTYCGTKSNSYLYFALIADQFDPVEVSKVLNLKPTSTRKKAYPTPQFTSWKYTIEAGSHPDLESSLEQLINIFEPKIDKINQLKRSFKLDTRLQFIIDIDIDPEQSTPYFPFNKRVIRFLAETETVVDFDIYKTDSLGLLALVGRQL